MIKIDKDIPPPMAKLIGATLDKMSVGDSFLLEGADESVRQALSSKTRKMKAEGKLFTSMWSEDGIRTWRLA